MKRFFLICSLTASWWIGGGWSPGLTEIVPDATLPQISQVRRSQGKTAISNGTRRGRNLFHSFREFSVAPGEIASFQHVESGIDNIFTRVTGSAASRINGAIEVLQSNDRISAANLFLLNPNGIIFGPNASLRIGGSFIATTANQINFADGTQFSAIQPQVNRLLTVSVPTGLQFGNRPGAIVNRSSFDSGNLDDLEFPILGLVGAPNRTLALIGGNILLTNFSSTRVDSGHIEIGSVASNSEVRFTPIDQGWSFDYTDVKDFGTVRLNQGSQLNGTGTAGSAIQIQADRFLMQDNSVIYTASAGARQIGGDIDVVARDAITVEDSSFLESANLQAGRGGNIYLSTRQLNIRNGAEVGASTKGRGRGGDVQIHATESVTVADIARLDSRNPDNLISLLYSQSFNSGRAGNLLIETDRLEVRSGGQISTNAFAAGNAGDLRIRADEISLSGISFDIRGKPLFVGDLPVPAGLFVGTNLGSQGNGGQMNITTRQLRLQDGAILQANTYGSGNAGDVNVRATESIEVSGLAEQDSPARITATSGGLPGFNDRLARSATGRGGNLTLSTDRLTVQNDGVIAVNSRNRRAAGAGNINIRANQIVLNDRGELNAQTESGDDAGIQLSGVDLLIMRRDSNISTSAGLNSGGGNGGDINLDASFILNAPGENSDITANAGAGNGGNIAIAAQGILGLAERNQRTFQSDITATSESGVDGEINISNPTIDPTQGVVELPSTIVDASQLIAQGCRAGNPDAADRLGEFVMTGRGGLPPNPTDLRNRDAVITDWVIAPQNSQSQAHRTTAEQAPQHAEAAHTSETHTLDPHPPIEAQGWMVGADGKVVLVAQAHQVTPQAPLPLPVCLSRSQLSPIESTGAESD